MLSNNAIVNEVEPMQEHILYVYTYKHMYIYACIDIYICVYIYIYIYICICHSLSLAALEPKTNVRGKSRLSCHQNSPAPLQRDVPWSPWRISRLDIALRKLQSGDFSYQQKLRVRLAQILKPQVAYAAATAIET